MKTLVAISFFTFMSLHSAYSQLYADEIQVINGLNGNVGIGSNNNFAGRLSIAGDTPLGLNTSGNLARAKFRVSGTNNAAKMHIDMLHNNGSGWQSDVLVLQGNGRVGIGVPDPQGKLQIGSGLTFAGTGSTHFNLPENALNFMYGSGSAMSFIKTGGDNYTVTHDINTTGYHISQNATSRDIRVISVSGGVRLTSGSTSWVAVSDERLKSNIQLISNSLERVMNWRGVTYNLTTDESNAQRRVGVIAQDILSTRPEAVTQDDEGYYGVRYTELIPDIIVAIQELKNDYNSALQEVLNEVKEQRKTIQQLQEENARLKSDRE